MGKGHWNKVYSEVANSFYANKPIYTADLIEKVLLRHYKIAITNVSL